MAAKSKRRARGRGAAATKVTATGDGRYLSATSRTPQGSAKRRTYAVADGQVAVGCVVPVGASRWRAIDQQGQGLGIFKTLRAAIRRLRRRKVRP